MLDVLPTEPSADLTPVSARSVLLTVLGELVWPSGEAARTSALLYVMGLLGIEERTTRQAIMRGARSGWIRSHRRGRAVSWSLTPAFESVFEEGSRRVVSLADSFDDWDGRWLVLLVTVPQALSTARKPLYAGLSWAGFGNPIAGIWLSPHLERREQLEELVAQLGLSDSAISFVGTVDRVGLDEQSIVKRGWDLDGLAVRYEKLWGSFKDLTPASGDETLGAHVRMLSQWQSFPFSDPQLPESLAPDWVGRRVSRHIEQLRREWSLDVHRRWAEINGDLMRTR